MFAQQSKKTKNENEISEYLDNIIKLELKLIRFEEFENTNPYSESRLKSFKIGFGEYLIEGKRLYG